MEDMPMIKPSMCRMCQAKDQRIQAMEKRLEQCEADYKRCCELNERMAHEVHDLKAALEQCEAALKEMQSEAREAVHMLNCAKVEGIALAAKKRLADACDAARAAMEEK